MCHLPRDSVASNRAIVWPPILPGLLVPRAAGQRGARDCLAYWQRRLPAGEVRGSADCPGGGPCIGAGLGVAICVAAERQDRPDRGGGDGVGDGGQCVGCIRMQAGRGENSRRGHARGARCRAAAAAFAVPGDRGPDPRPARVDPCPEPGPANTSVSGKDMSITYCVAAVQFS